MTAKRIATVKNADPDSLTATWLAQRYLSADPTEVVFMPKNCQPEHLADFDWVVKVGVPDRLGLNGERKRHPFPERYATSFTGHTWAQLLGMGKPVAHLVDLIDVIHTGGNGRPATALQHLYGRLCGFFSEAKSRAPDELALYQAVAGWLDSYEAGFGLGAVTPVDWDRVGHYFPKEVGTYVMMLKTVAPGPVMLGRTGSLGRMEVLPGFYLYSGSAGQKGGLSARYRHHLTPAVELALKWQVDYLRLRCSVVEVWFTTAPSQSTFSKKERDIREWQMARCVLNMPGASVPVRRFGSPKFGCPAYLAYFKSRPSFRAFQARSRRPPLEWRVQRVVLDQEHLEPSEGSQ